ncbi:MAG: carboxylesterase family protein [Hyphomicrobiaceae bacterium]|nr:carboxylesterase family protein [Hyphomicrobiaceae bacterium]
MTDNSFKRSLRVAAVAFCAAMAFPAIAFANPEITISQGTLAGTEGDGVVQFSGVRYAMPPVGENRWMPPVPVGAATGPVDATKPGPGCAQGPSPWGTPSTSEDCLFLNITVPGPANAMGFWQNKPVLVWFHGGGFTGGSGDVYDAQALARENDVIVVTVNYRLGSLGFFAHPALDAEDHVVANYGLLDQQQALKWLQANIASFGGNPNNLTVFGESAGAIAIYTHLVSPLASGLFQKAIIESGAPADEPLSVAETQGNALAEKVGCPTTADADAAACLRAVPVEQLLAAQATPIATIIDGKLLTAPVLDLLRSGNYNRMPVMNGTNHDEGNLIAAFIWDLSGAPLDAKDMGTAVNIVGNFIPRVGYTDRMFKVVETAYDPSKYDVPDLAASQIITDGVIACPAFEANKIMAAFNPVFEYEMADINAPSVVAGPVSFPYRAGHFSELQYIFDLSSITIDGTPALTDAQQALGKQMRAYWASFARNGNPNGPGLPQWNMFNAKAGGPVQSLNTPQSRGVGNFAAAHQCDFWAGVERK